MARRNTPFPLPNRQVALALVCSLGLNMAACGGTPVAPAFSQPASQAASSPAASAPATTPSTAPTAPSPSPSLGPTVSILPANFTATIDNPWFPLIAGTTFTYKGTKDEQPATDTFTIGDETIVIDGVTCRIIRDRLYLDGKLEEKTADYYAQDLAGNVWYFGEDTQELDARGRVTSTEGSWRAGVDGALPGLFMEATPTIGHEFAQELYKGHAEDHFQVVSLTASAKVPYGTFRNVLMTREWTPLEPDVVDNKYYVHGVGEVREVTVKGPHEELALVKIDKR